MAPVIGRWPLIWRDDHVLGRAPLLTLPQMRMDGKRALVIRPRSASSAGLVGVLKQQMPCQVGRIGVAKT